MNRSKSIVVYAIVAVVILVVSCALMCQVRSCARKGLGQIGQIGRLAAGLTGSSLLPTSNQTEPQKPNVVPPGHSALPRASRRPVFGSPSAEGIEIEIEPRKHESHETDMTRFSIGKDGRVRNLGKETLSVRVTRVGPAWVEWDLSVGVCALARVQDGGVRTEDGGWRGVSWKGQEIDFGGKVKLVDFRPGRVVQIGVPVIYATTGGPGVGCDVRITGMEWLALDVGWFPMVKRAGLGVSLNIP